MRLHRPVDNIDSYMKSIEQYPRLTHEEERELAWKIHNGTPEEAQAARDKLICCNLRLVVAVAHSYKRYNLSLSDLIQEGNVGLCVAADKFDPDRCSKFSVAASFRIRQTIRLALVEQTRTLTLPIASARLAAKAAKTRNAIIAETGREPSDEELAAALGISLTRLEGARTADIGICSINDPVKEGSDTTFEDMLDTEDDTAHKQAAEKVAAIEKMLEAMKQLNDMDRFILEHVYGIGCKPVSVDVLTTETGWCARRIRGRLCSLQRQLKTVIGNDALEI